MKVRGPQANLGRAILTAASVCLLAGSVGSAPAPDVRSGSSPAQYGPPIILFFEPGSAEIAAHARPVANRALAEAVREWRSNVRVEAYAPAASGDDGEALAEQRAENVTAFLLASGIPPSRIEPAHALASVPVDPVIGLGQERVEIRLRPSSDSVIADLGEAESRSREDTKPRW